MGESNQTGRKQLRQEDKYVARQVSIVHMHHTCKHVSSYIQ